jgi:hypothetical protein
MDGLARVLLLLQPSTAKAGKEDDAKGYEESVDPA